MRLFTIVAVSILAGVGLGYAATVAEFGMSPPTPRLAVDDYRKSTGPPPRLVVDQLVHNFGTMRQNEEGIHTYVLRNEGRGQLVIKPGQPSCKCAVSKVSRTIVPPGESAEVTLTWRTGNSQGEYNKSAPIQTNDPENSWIRLVLMGKVVPEFRFEPSLVWVRTLSPHDASQHEARLYFFGKKKYEILDYQFTDEETKPFYNLTYEPIAPDELIESATSGYVIRVSIKPGMPLGPIRQNVTFVTSFQTRIPVRLSFTGDVRKDITIFGPYWNRTTETIDFGGVKRGVGRKIKLSLHVHGKHKDEIAFSVKQVEPEDLKVTIGDRSDLADGVTVRFPLEIEIPPDAEILRPETKSETTSPSPDKSGRIVLGTTHPDYPEMVLKVQLQPLQ